jgi:SAM-dependent methyltransferase
MPQSPTKVQYRPDVFDVPDLQRAKGIILTDEGPGADTETRWVSETPYLMELIGKILDLRSDQVMLDYGCGIGRLSKAAIEQCGCSVIGVDISASMRRLAGDYVRSERFVAVSPAQFDLLLRSGLRVDAAIAVWVLQHCLKPAEDIARIRHSVVPTGKLIVVNMPMRAVPATHFGDNKLLWVEDGVDISALLRTAFAVNAEGTLDSSRTPRMADVGSYWLELRQR